MIRKDIRIALDVDPKWLTANGDRTEAEGLVELKERINHMIRKEFFLDWRKIKAEFIEYMEPVE